MAEPGITFRDILVLIRDELMRARTAVEGTSGAVQILRERFFSEIDRIVGEYQALILEYAQYVTLDDLEHTISQDERQAVARRLSPRDVIVRDSVLGGRGKSLRLFFGLPDPSQ
jgi:hypothetical protein